MSLPDDYSLICEKCRSYNLSDGIIKDGLIYCENCIETIDDYKDKIINWIKKAPDVDYVGEYLLKRIEEDE